MPTKTTWYSEWPLDAISVRLNSFTGNVMVAVAAYRYESKMNIRAGGIFLYDLNLSTSPALLPLASSVGSGVYDLTWLQDCNVLAATFASGDFLLMNCGSGNVLAPMCKLKLTDNAVLTNLAIDESGNVFSCGDHHGQCYVIERSAAGLFLKASWLAHKDAPTWSTAFDAERGVMYTCGDDNLISAWDMRELCSESTPQFSISGHDAGVCAVMPISGTNLLLSGGYDETVRVWDVRYHAMGAAAVDTLKLGCGIWKISKRKINSTCFKLLGACLEGGIVAAGLDCSIGKLHLLNTSADWCDLQPTDDDSQLVYGADFTPDASHFVASTHSSKNGTGSIQFYS